jgi:hypothetical protein
MMVLGLDLDGTIDESPNFFRMLSHAWPGPVHIVTFRQSRDHAVEYASKLGVRFTELHLAESHEHKSKIIETLGIHVYIDDSDEAIIGIPSDVFVLKVRHADNFDFSTRRWQYQADTGYLISPAVE